MLRNTDLSRLDYVSAARSTDGAPAPQGVEIVKDVQGREVLTAHAPILPLRWLMFVELPIDEAYAPLYESIKRSSYLLLGGLTLAFLAGLFLARKMIMPIQQLREGAAQIGAGNLEQRISIKTGDELEALADQFNDMAGRLEEILRRPGAEGRAAHARAERIAGAADRDLARCSRSSAVRLASWSRCSRPCWRMRRGFARPRSARCCCVRATDSAVSRSTTRLRHMRRFDRKTRSVPTQRTSARSSRRNQAGHPHRGHGSGELRMTRSPSSAAPGRFVVVPMLKEDELIGAIGIYRQEVRPFTDKQIELVTNFAAQAVIAIENVRLLNELRARTDDLARSVGELQALGEVSQAVNSTLDLEQVLTTIVQRAVQLSRTDAGAIYVFDEARQEFKLRATYGMSEEMIVAITDRRIGTGDAHIGPAATQRKPIQVADIRERAADAGQRDQPARGLSRGADHPAAPPRPHRRRAGGAAQIARRIPAIHHRPAGNLRRPVGGGDPERQPVPRDRGEGQAARGREPAQVAVPRQHEPRAAHAAQRHPRLHRAHSRRHLRRGAARRRRPCSSASRATAATCSA